MKFVIISSLVSMLMAGNPVFFNTTPANITQTPYGTITRDFTVVQDSPTVVKMGFFDVPLTQSYVSTFHYHFNKPAYGQFTMNYFKSVSDVRWEMVIDGGSVLSYTDSSVTIMVRGETDVYFSMIISSLQLAFNQQQFTLVSNQIIELADTDNEILQDIDDNLTYISSEQQLIQANTNTIKNILMSTFGGYVTNEGSLYTDMQSLITAINNSYNEDVLIYEQIQFSNVANSLIYQLMTENNRYVQYTNRYRIYGDVWLYDHTKNTGTQDWTNSFYIPSGKTYSFVFYTVGSLGGQYNVYSRDGNITTLVYEREIASAKYVYEFNIKNNGSTSNPVAIEFSKDIWFTPIYLGNSAFIPINIQAIMGVNYGDMYTYKMDELKNAIQNMAVNVNNLTVNATGITYNTTNNDVNNSVTNYENNITIINNIENNFKTEFDNANQNYNIDNIPITNELVSTGNFMKDVATQLYGLDIIKYPTALLLLGIVIIALLG